MLPTFLIIGTQRCATGWLAQCLREHPDIYLAPDETRFFDRHFSKGAQWWNGLYFSEYEDQKAIGEKTANYLYDHKCPARIHKTLPDVKLICCLRNPVERLNSALLMKARTKPDLRKLRFDELVENEPDLIERGKYCEQLSRYFKLFPMENILVTLYDDKEQDPGHYIKSICQFLDVDENFVPQSLHLQTKPGAFENTSPYLSKITSILLSKKSPLKQLYNSFRPKGHNAYSKVVDYERILDIYRDEIKKLEVLINRDLSCWRNGENRG